MRRDSNKRNKAVEISNFNDISEEQKQAFINKTKYKLREKKRNRSLKPSMDLKKLMKLSEERRTQTALGHSLSSIVHLQYDTHIDDVIAAEESLSYKNKTTRKNGKVTNINLDVVDNIPTGRTLKQAEPDIRDIFQIIKPANSLQPEDIGIVPVLVDEPEDFELPTLSDHDSIDEFEVLEDETDEQEDETEESEEESASEVEQDEEPQTVFEKSVAVINDTRRAVHRHKRFTPISVSLRRKMENQREKRFMEPELRKMRGLHNRFYQRSSVYTTDLFGLKPHEARQLARYRLAIKETEMRLDDTLNDLKVKVDKQLAARDLRTEGLHLTSSFAPEKEIAVNKELGTAVVSDDEFIALSGESRSTTPECVSPLLFHHSRGQLSSIVIPPKAKTSLGFNEDTEIRLPEISDSSKTTQSSEHIERIRAQSVMDKPKPKEETYLFYKAAIGNAKSQKRHHWLSATQRKKGTHKPPFKAIIGKARVVVG
ncbi:hypothetical protein PCE1_003451 [Barthelona sp. PCE]